MPGLLNSSSVLMCPHGGSVSAITTNSRSKAAGDFLLRASDTFIVGGCPLNVAGAPHLGTVLINFTQPRVSGR